MLVRDHIAVGFPPTTGAALAGVILVREELQEGLELDVRGLPAALLTTGFYNAFLQRIYEHNLDMLETARNISWVTDYPFQVDVATRAMKDFRPYKDWKNFEPGHPAKA